MGVFSSENISSIQESPYIKYKNSEGKKELKTILKNNNGQNNHNLQVNNIFSGSITKVTLRMSVPVLISQLLVLTHTFVDTYFISLIDKSSTAMLSGPGLIFPLYFMYVTLCRGLYMGTSSLTARGIGQKNDNIIRRTGDSGLLLAILIGLPTLVLSFIYGKDMIGLIAGSKLSNETITYASQYFYCLIPGIVLLLAQNTLAGILQGEGLTKYIATGTLLSTIVNLVLTPSLIFVLKLGVKGSSLATSIAIGVNVAFYLVLFAKKKTTMPIEWKFFNVDKKILKEILRIGIPLSTGMILTNISIILLNNVVGSISESAMNSWVLVNRTDQMFLVAGYAIGMSTIPMVGQNFGRKNYKRTKEVFNTHIVMTIATSIFLAILYVVFAPQIFSLFSSVPKVILGSVNQVRLLAITTVINTSIFVIICFFQSIGKPKPVLASQIIRTIIYSIPFILYVMNIEIKSMNTVYICFGAGNIIAPLLGYIWAQKIFRGKQFKSTIQV